MSNFTCRTKNPKTGTFDDAEYLDNYFGPHIYAVRFPDGTIYREDSVDYWETDEPDPNGFELQDDGMVTSADNTSNTLKTQLKTSSVEKVLQNVKMQKASSVEPVVSDELREQIVKVRYGKYDEYDDLSPSEQEEIDGLAMFVTQYGDKREREGRIDERLTVIHEDAAGKNVVYMAMARNAAQHNHSFNTISKICSCGVSAAFMVGESDFIAELKKMKEQV